MPLYEYRCSQCGRTFEKLQKFSDAPTTVCDLCQGGPVERVISPPAFHLKGGGWYKDGYGSGASSKTDSGSAKPAASTSSETKSETKSGTKTESKPAASTDTTSSASSSGSK